MRKLTLEVGYQLAHDLAEHEVAQERSHERERHAHDAQQKVAECQVQEEHVRHCPHSLVLDQRQDDQEVPGDLHPK